MAGCRSSSEGIPPDTTRPETGGSGGNGGRGGSGGNGGRGGTAGITAGGTGGGGASGGAAGMADMGGDRAPDGSDAADGPTPDTAMDTPPADMRTPDLAPDRMPDTAMNLAQGAACRANGECRSGFCAQGFCCNMVCSEPCLSCAMADTGMANGRCEPNRSKVGMKCGQGCQQVLSNIPAVVDKTCDNLGRCLVPQIPQNFELCADMDPCTTLNCDQDTRAHTARCVKTGCAAGQCCCDGGMRGRMCVRTNMCTGAGRACQP